MNVEAIVSILDRDGALELDNEERTYGYEDEVNEIDWDKLWSSPDKFGEDPWLLTNSDVIGEILGGIGRIDNPRPWPSDVGNSDAAIWDVCAWYQPIHFFAYDWGIFIREDCLIKQASRIAAFLPPSHQPLMSSAQYATMLLKASFAAFYFHEHFHHKVESFGVRLHVVSGVSKYLPYKKNVYRRYLHTDDCLEEALANADSFLRFQSRPYTSILDQKIIRAVRDYLSATFPFDPPGYRMASNYLSSASFVAGSQLLQSQILEATNLPLKNPNDWTASPQMMRSFFNFKSNIYSVVSRGNRTVLPTKIVPKSCSTQTLIKIFQSRGYSIVQGGKGSHVKLRNAVGETMIIPGNRKDLSIGVLNSALKSIGLSIGDLSTLGV